MRGLCLLLFVFFAACAEAPPADEALTPDPAAVGALLGRELVGREDFMMYDSGDVQALHYSEAAAIYGAAKLAGETGDKAMIESLEARYQRMIDESLPNTANHVDANVVGVAPLQLYLETGGQDYLKAGLALADGQWAETTPDGITAEARYWIDDIWMIGALQIEAYRATGDAKYLDRAARMAAAYITRLQQPNGLFYHGLDAPFFWGRGNGWVAAGLAEILSELPEDHPDYPVVSAGYEKMMAALLNYQAADGMWRQLIDDPDAWEETSSTAMFGFAFVKGVKHGLLEDPRYKQAYEKAWRALAGHIDSEGRVDDVCVGTGQSQDAQYYLDRPRSTGDFHGQAPVLWFAAALLE